MGNVQAITALHRTFGEGQVVDAIQDVGFATAIQPQQTVDLRAEAQAGFEVVFKLDKVERLQNHEGGELFGWHPDF